MCTVHGLQVPHGVPVVFDEHHRVGARQIETQAAHMGGQQQHVDGGVVVEPGDYGMALAGWHAAQQVIDDYYVNRVSNTSQNISIGRGMFSGSADHSNWLTPIIPIM